MDLTSDRRCLMGVSSPSFYLAFVDEILSSLDAQFFEGKMRSRQKQTCARALAGELTSTPNGGRRRKTFNAEKRALLFLCLFLESRSVFLGVSLGLHSAYRQEDGS